MLKTTKKSATLVDILGPDKQTFDVSAAGELRITVPKQHAYVLVPQDQAKP